MSRILIQGAFALVALFGVITHAAAGQATTTPAYLFTAQPTAIKAGVPASFTVQIMSPDNKSITGAKVSATRVDMGPAGMAGMTAPVEPVASTDPSKHVFSTTVTMAGQWAVTVEAKIPGEAEPVRGQIILDAK